MKTISLTRPESIKLKINGQKTYNRITDIALIPGNLVEEKAFSLKNSNIIRQIVDNPKIKNVTLDMYSFDCVDRVGIDRYDEPDYIYGIRIVYEQPLTKNFTLFGEYIRQTLPEMHDYTWINAEEFVARAVVQNLPKSLFNDTNDYMVLYKDIIPNFGDKIVDTSKYTSMGAIVKYKAAVMKRRAKR